MKKTLVFIHGWSVTNLNTYGELPERLQLEAAANGVEIDIQHIFLSRYISFHDEVGLDDIAKGLDSAIKEQLREIQSFVCITHSTGGPVVRHWWNYFYDNSPTKISHLIMLAPANFGSALAQLGKARLSRIKSFFEGVEPGQRVLNWLELGSKSSWELNKKWILSDANQIGEQGLFPFVLTGQSIDRKLYDHLNSYTGEIGSDGVVRTAAANLNSRYIHLKQNAIKTKNNEVKISSTLDILEYKESPEVPLRIITGKSHSGLEKGIMNSVRKSRDQKSKETITSILKCINVDSIEKYNELKEQFKLETSIVQKNELIETAPEFIFFHTHFIHDRFSQVIFRITDSEGYPITDFDLLLTAGQNNNPNNFPPGFVADRQQNSINKEIITYYFNYDLIVGAPKNEFRKKTEGITQIGLKIIPRPQEGFVRFVTCEIKANEDLLQKTIQPNSTTLIDIVLQRVVSKGVFQINNITQFPKDFDFSKTKWEDKGIIE